ITCARKKFLEDILKDKNVKISINALRDRNHFEFTFRKIIQRDSGYSDEVLYIVNKCMHGKSVLENQNEIIKDLFCIRKEEEVSEKYKGHFKNVIKNLTEEQLDELI